MTAHSYYMTFEQLELIEPIRKALKKEKYTTPTPIQAEAIPVVLDGSDLLGCAQTGRKLFPGWAVKLNFLRAGYLAG